MLILTSSRAQAETDLASGCNGLTWACISITEPLGFPHDPDYQADAAIDPRWPGCRGILRLRFWDTDDEATGMKQRDAEKIAFFVKAHIRDETQVLVIHCKAGKSRSVGVAAAILQYQGVDWEVEKLFRFGTPNCRCYRLVLSELQGGGI